MSRQNVYIEADGTVTARLMVRRPIPTTDWNKNGPFRAGPVLPKGAILHIPIVPGVRIVSEQPYGELDHEQVLQAAAAVPCPHLDFDFGEEGPYYFTCDRFDYTGGQLALCLGDKCRCPMAEVRAEASTATVSSRTTETGGRSS